MANVVMVETKVPGQPTPPTFPLSLPSESITVRELLREYVMYEVDTHNSKQKSVAAKFESEEEKILNKRVQKPVLGVLNGEVECERAFKAFESNQLMVLLNKYQPSELDETVNVSPDIKITFLRLVQLVGG